MFKTLLLTTDYEKDLYGAGLKLYNQQYRRHFQSK